MIITVFQADKGDCFLVEGADGKRVLVDGGMAKSFTEHVAPALGELQKANIPLDVVYVSHIDEDHISGILKLMDDKTKWAVFDYQQSQGNLKFKEPGSIRPPEVRVIWHNAFDAQLPDEAAADCASHLATIAAVLRGSDAQDIVPTAEAYQEIATSVRQAIVLSNRISSSQLNIKLNPEFGGGLMIAGKLAKPISIGPMEWEILGPSEYDLRKLREEWDTWLSNNKSTLKKIEIKNRKDSERIGNLSSSLEIDRLVGHFSEQAISMSVALANDLAKAMAASKEVDLAARTLGRRENVTVPNLASLMFYVEEKKNGSKTTAILTGDGHHSDVLKGLEKLDKLDEEGTIHVDLLKVQHHGSEHNIDREFLKKVTADHYVFCGNGAHENPDLEVLDVVIDSRLVAKHRGKNASATNDFKLWFNASPGVFKSDQPSASEKRNQEHMEKVVKLVEEREKKSGGKLKSFFLKGSHFKIEL